MSARDGDKARTERRGLTVGDGLAVVALLLFIGGWVAGWCFAFGQMTEEEVRDMSTMAGIIVGSLALFPPMWAARLVAHIVKGPWVLR